MPPAARITDDHTCPKVDPPAHKGGEIQTGARQVKIGYQDAISPEPLRRIPEDMSPEDGARLGLETTLAVMKKAGVAV